QKQRRSDGQHLLLIVTGDDDVQDGILAIVHSDTSWKTKGNKESAGKRRVPRRRRAGGAESLFIIPYGGAACNRHVAWRSFSGAGSLKLRRNSWTSPSSCMRLNSRHRALRSQFR